MEIQNIMKEVGTPSIKGIADTLGVKYSKLYNASKRSDNGVYLGKGEYNWNVIEKFITVRLGTSVCSIDNLREFVETAVQNDVNRNKRDKRYKSQTTVVNEQKVANRKYRNFEMSSGQYVCLNDDPNVYRIVVQNDSCTILRPVKVDGSFASDRLKSISNSKLNLVGVGPAALEREIAKRFGGTYARDEHQEQTIRVDVSEIKTYKNCKRQWKLSSRNEFHLRPVVTPSHFAIGTVFHESLHQLYLGVSLEKVLEYIEREAPEEGVKTLTTMINGYYENVLPEDKKRYKVLDIEHHFSFTPQDPLTGKIIDENVLVCGSIDMIVLDVEENAIYGFEHKTCKNFRDESFMWMDEQPRVYSYALMQYVKEYNEKHLGEKPVVLGGIYMNEVKKLVRDFQYKRTLCEYTNDDLANFLTSFFADCAACHKSVETNDKALPSPSYMGCSMCDYKPICEKYKYGTLDRNEVVDDFADDFKVCSEDHLDEKVERVGAQ